MADVNPLDVVVSLITTNYNTSNADNITPTVAIIYEKPTEKEPRPNQDFIYVYSYSPTLHNVTGMGNNGVADVSEFIAIDIRVKPSNAKQANKINDDHARKVLAEVKRILFSNITTPGTGIDIIDPNSVQVTDLSNGMRGIFRYVIRINMFDYCRDLTA